MTSGAASRTNAPQCLKHDIGCIALQYIAHLVHELSLESVQEQSVAELAGWVTCSVHDTRGR